MSNSQLYSLKDCLYSCVAICMYATGHWIAGSIAIALACISYRMGQMLEEKR